MNGEIRKEFDDFARKKLGIKFNDIDLFVTALTHRSYVNEHKNANIDHNERLEFLGDAVLELVVSDFLCRNYNYPEGVMTALRSSLVRTESICEAGKKIGYEPLIRLSHGEQAGTERAHESIIADCFEATLGAIYLDQGYEAAKKLVDEYIIIKIDDIIKEGSWRDPKSLFQEIVQHYDVTTPIYRTLGETGPDHNKLFSVATYVGKQKLGEGSGHSKQVAQAIAAKQGLAYYRKKYPDFEEVLMEALNRMK